MGVLIRDSTRSMLRSCLFFKREIESLSSRVYGLVEFSNVPKTFPKERMETDSKVERFRLFLGFRVTVFLGRVSVGLSM